MKALVLIGCVFVALCPLPALAGDGEAACAKVTKTLNLLVDDVVTRCVVLADGQEMLVIADRRVLGGPQRREAYLLAAVAASGDALGAFAKARVQHVYVTDLPMAQTQKAWRVSAADATRLQREVKAERISFDEFRAAVAKAAPLVDVPSSSLLPAKP